MNTVSPGLIDPIALAAVRADLRALVGDSDVATSFTVTTTTGSTFHSGSGVETPTTEVDAVSGWRGTLSSDEVDAERLYEVGDVRFYVDPSLLGVSPSAARSTVTEGGVLYQVVGVKTGALGALLHLVARSTL